MYAAYFGLRELPFNNTPDPRFFFSTSDHEEALASLIYTVQERKGVALLTGEIGAGKTLLSRMMLRHFGGTITFAHITHSVQSAQDLTESVCTELEIPFSQGSSHAQLTRNLHDFLLEQFASNKPVVLVLDEAQNLPLDGFEQLRMVGNLEADDAKLLQIIIVGQPELRGLISSPALRQLRQRICRSFHLGGMNRSETQSYILHRLSVAGAPDEPIFNASAIDRIAAMSGGLPRVVNTICDTAMVNAYAENVKTIDGSFIDALEDQTIAAGAAEGRALAIPAPALAGQSLQAGPSAALGAVAPPPMTPTPIQTTPAAAQAALAQEGFASSPAVAPQPAPPYAPAPQQIPQVQPPSAPVQPPNQPPPPTVESFEQHAADVESRLRTRRLDTIQTPVQIVAPATDQVAERMHGELSRLSQEVQGRVDEAISGLSKLGHRFSRTVAAQAAPRHSETHAPPPPVDDFPSAVSRARREGAVLARREARMAELLSTLDSFIHPYEDETPTDGWRSASANDPMPSAVSASATTAMSRNSMGLGNLDHPFPEDEPMLPTVATKTGQSVWRSTGKRHRSSASSGSARNPFDLDQPSVTSSISQLVAEADVLVGIIEAQELD